MSGLEQFKPQLKTGRISPHGNKIIYEIDEPFDQIILPIETLDFLTQCNGRFTMSEIVENIYRKKNTIQFKLIYQTLIALNQKGFLENSNELEILPGPYLESEKEGFWSFTPFFNVYLAQRISNKENHPFFFYALSLLIFATGILGLPLLLDATFSFDYLKRNGSYASGFAFIFLVASSLLTLKHILKATLLLTLTGKLYNLMLTFNGFALYLKCGADSLFLNQNRLFNFLYNGAVFLSYLAFLQAYSLFSLDEFGSVSAIAMTLFFFDLNPYQPSDISTYFRSITKNDNLKRIFAFLEVKSLLALINPIDRRNEKNAPWIFNLLGFAFLWSLTAIGLSGSALFHHFPSLLENIRLSLSDVQIVEAVTCLLLISALVNFNVILLFNFYRLFSQYFHPFSRLKKWLFPPLQTAHQLTENDNKILQKIMSEFSLFSHFSEELLATLIAQSELRSYSSHSTILSEQERSRHLYVLISGEVRARGKTTIAPALLGEVSLLDETKSAQSFITQCRSLILAIPAEALKGLAQNDLHSREIESFKNSILVSQYFSNAPMFRDLSDHIAYLFITKGRIEHFKKEQVLFKQGDIADGFYLLLKGSVEVLVENRPITQIHEGGFFGEIAMIADIPRTATLYALEDCHTLRITREAFWEILAQDLTLAMFIESVGEMRIQDDVDLIKQNSRRKSA